jgi:hypothetical protein
MLDPNGRIMETSTTAAAYLRPQTGRVAAQHDEVNS